ncbi:thermonuclease family protein [Patescibacteria group bacterium]|nr:thermonuclease family protein [Patescibacteria group bacterium]
MLFIRNIKILIISILILTIGLIILFYSKDNNESFFKVIKVIDGDTIVIEGGEIVRYIGIDTPETNKENNDCFAQEAWNMNRELVEGKEVKLKKDISERDKYGRLLRYVWVDDLFINEYLVKNGYASASTFPPDVKYADDFLKFQKKAKEENLGLWSSCQVNGIICSVNVYDCSDFETNQEAQSIYDSCGGVDNDIHQLDGDNDGLSCESLP